MKTVQFFNDEYLARCADMTAHDIAVYLDDFRRLHGANTANHQKSKLISIKIPESLLATFKTKAALNDKRYQTQIKQLMMDWVQSKEK